ncbi:WhiB family transcriptional regulator [Mycobacterium simulans]|uniref:WhiB family transcriptional regulator n=1 Tax=Mycobacterium simulans TaxID=627089 RepID=UPI00174DA734
MRRRNCHDPQAHRHHPPDQPKPLCGSRHGLHQGQAAATCGREEGQLIVSTLCAGAAQRNAAAICRHCPVIQECATDALDNALEYGIWGGMTERQRRALPNRHPEVVS